MTLPLSLKPAGRFIAFVNNQLAMDHHCLQIQVPSGGQRAHTAVFEKIGEVYESDPGPPVEESLRVLFNSPTIYKDDDAVLDYVENEECALYFYPFDYNEVTEPRVLVHWGRIVSGAPKLQGNQLIVTSRTDGHLLGGVIDRSYFHFGNDGEDELEMPIVFNPVFDGVIVGNHSGRPNSDPANDKRQYFWHPDEEWLNPLWGAGYEGYNNAWRPKRWTLAAAVAYLMEAHANQYWVKIPTLAEIEAMLVDAPEPIDVKIPRGSYLPEALERLLGPYGYSFKFRPIDEGDEASPDKKHLFFIWRRDRGLPPHNGTGTDPGGGGGSGVEVPITLEQVKTSDKLRSDIDDCGLDVDLVNGSASNIFVLGDPIRVEGTFELVPGWLKERETTDVKETAKNKNQLNVGAEQRRVWRDYVLNETGKYNKWRRGEGAGAGPDLAMFDASAFFGSPQSNRARKFLPTLALDATGNPLGSNKGVQLEVWDGKKWKVFDGPFDILQNECGVRLSSNTVPREFMRVRRVRITATIESDERLRLETGTLPNKISGSSPRPVVIETRNRYKKYEIRDNGQYASIYAPAVAGGDPSNQVDQTAEMQTLVDRLKDSYKKTAFRGQIKLTDQKWYGNELVGRRVEKFNQRNVDLNSDSEAGADDKSYPIITAVTMDIQTQSETLFLDAYAG